MFSSTGVIRKLRWFVVGSMAISLIGLAVVARLSVQDLSPARLLRNIVNLEQSNTKDRVAMQELSTMLAICGREADAELVSGSTACGGDRATLSPDSSQPLDTSRFQMLVTGDNTGSSAKGERVQPMIWTVQVATTEVCGWTNRLNLVSCGLAPVWHGAKDLKKLQKPVSFCPNL